MFVGFFCCFTPQVNSYGHGGTVSSPNHTFSWASLNKQLTSTSCTYFRLWLTTILLEWFSGKEENDSRNYFIINLHESMGPGRDWTRDPWICSQTRICCQTLYRLRYSAGQNKHDKKKITAIIFCICFGCSEEMLIIETVLLSTQNICFDWEIRNLFSVTHYLSSICKRKVWCSKSDNCSFQSCRAETHKIEKQTVKTNKTASS